jgi:hypothetical protein
MSLFYTLLGKKYYSFHRYIGNQYVDTKEFAIVGQYFWADKANRLLYIIPPPEQCKIRGNKHEVWYDFNDAAPMGELESVARDWCEYSDTEWQRLMRDAGIETEGAQSYKHWWNFLSGDKQIRSKPYKFVPPLKIERVGVRPSTLFESYEAKMTEEVLKKPKDKWEAIEKMVVSLSVVAGILVMVWMLTHR